MSLQSQTLAARIKIATSTGHTDRFPEIICTKHATLHGGWQPTAEKACSQSGRCLTSSKPLQLGFNLAMQVLPELSLRQTIDYFVEKATGNQALGGEVINAPALKIKQFFGLHLPGGCSVRTTHIVR